MKLYFFTVFILAIINHHNCQDISFPDDDDSDTYISGSKPIIKRKPIKIEDRCPLNMLLYPGDGSQSSWVCDCKPKHVYFPVNDSCFEVFSRGPCPEHHYVYLATNESVPSCMKNPCANDKFRPYNGTCYEFNALGGPCKNYETLSTNEITFQLDCKRLLKPNKVIIDVTCRKNYFHSISGKCKRRVKM